MTVAESFAYWGYSMGWSVVRKMPEKRAYNTFNRFADQMWRRHGPSVKQYEKNLRRVVPEASQTQIRQYSREGLRSYARYWCEAFRMPDWPESRILDYPVDGIELIDEAMAKRQGVVFAAPHGGNYDHGAAMMATRYGSLTTVAERLKPEKLFQRFLAFRQSLGMEIIPTGTPNATERLVARVNENRLVGLVADRDLSRQGIPVQFFGEEARMPAGAAIIACRTGATLLAVAFYYRNGKAGAKVRPVEVPRGGVEEEVIPIVVQSLADRYAEGIAHNPSDWHMLQPLWTADLDPDRDPMRRKPRT